jgi:hypothetical protein
VDSGQLGRSNGTGSANVKETVISGIEREVEAGASERRGVAFIGSGAYITRMRVTSKE